MAPVKRTNFNALEISFPLTCNTAKLKAANVPRREAFTMGLMNFFSNSSAIATALPKNRMDEVSVLAFYRFLLLLGLKCLL